MRIWHKLYYIFFIWTLQSFANEDKKMFVLNKLEKHFIETWLETENLPDDVLRFVVKRMRPEALELIKDDSVRDRAIKCQKAFTKGD